MTEQTQKQFKCYCEDCDELIIVDGSGSFPSVGKRIRAAGWVKAGGFLRFRCPDCARGM